MAQNSKIEWTHHTANLWWGCTEVHEGCDNCYARVLDNRWSSISHWGNDTFRRPIKSVWKDLARYQRIAQEKGEMHRVFVGSMMDIFEKPMTVIGDGGVQENHTGELRSKLFGQIDAGHYPNLIFLFLTKRPSNINKYIPERWKLHPPENVMFGTSPVNPATYKTLTLQLLGVMGKRFLSIEPQLAEIEPININLFDWVIVGGESGAKKRPFDCDWARKIRDACARTGVPFFMKQIDKVQPIADDLMIREFPKMPVGV